MGRASSTHRRFGSGQSACWWSTKGSTSPSGRRNAPSTYYEHEARRANPDLRPTRAKRETEPF